MTTETGTNSIQRTARLAGLLYLLTMPFSIFGFFYVPARLVVPGNAAATADNIAGSEGLFRAGIVAWLIGITIYVVLSLLLYRLLKPVNKTYALLMVIFILLSIPIAFINEINRLAVLLLLSGADYLKTFQTDRLQAQAMFFLDLHAQGIGIAQIFWALWLFPMGYLVFKSGFLPRILGILLSIAGLGYLAESFAFFLFPASGVTIVWFTFLGEVVFPVWLLVKGVNVERWEGLAPGSV